MSRITDVVHAAILLVAFACGMFVGRCPTVERDVRNQLTAQEVHTRCGGD